MREPFLVQISQVPSVRGKTVRTRPAQVVGDYVAVLRSLVDANKALTLAADAFFVDGTAFLLTVARRIKFVTAEHLPVRTALSLSKHMKRVLDVYGRAGFRVRTILMDGEGTQEAAHNIWRIWSFSFANRTANLQNQHPAPTLPHPQLLARS